jgi:cytochrome c oxidase cbb3-type subunit 3
MRPVLLTPLLALRLLALSSSPQAQPNAASTLAPGKTLFEGHCAVCHGINGSGGGGPSLRRVRLVRGPDDTALRALISDSIPPDMPDGWYLSEEDVRDLAAYVRSLAAIHSQPIPSRQGNPISFTVDGHQRIAISADRVLYVFGL